MVFMNVKQGSMSVKEYALKFQLSKYASHLVAGPRSRMNKFVMGVSDLVSEECRSAMLICDMDLSRLMTNAEQMEEEKWRKRSNEAKRARFEEKFQSRKGGRFFQGQGSSHASNGGFANDYPRAQSSGGLVPNAMCPKCGRGHGSPFLRDTNACYGCGEVGHKKIDCPRNRNKAKEVRPQGANVVPLGRGGQQGGAPRHNRFYALQWR